MTVNNIIKNKPYLAWYIKDSEKLSEESVLEHVLNYGNWNDVQLFIKIKGMNGTAELFNKSLKNKRTNYSPAIKSYFFRYFINKVKVTFFHYPFIIQRNIIFEQILRLPDLITLGAMKSFALGRRAKWKDYVDLYFIFQKHSFQELMDKTNSIFKTEFNEKLFRIQLAYFEDIDYSEKINYMKGFEKKDDDIKQFLEKISLI